MSTLTIGRLAASAGVNVQTVRYYERRGLIAPVARRRSGYREFAPQDVRRLRFIKKAQVLGFRLDEIADLLALRADDDGGGGAVRRQAEGKIDEINARIADLERMRDVLECLVGTCRRRAASESCPILSALDEEAPCAS